MLHIKFGFDWPSGSEKKMFEYYGQFSDGTMIRRNRKLIDFTQISINQSDSQKFRLINIQKVLKLAKVFSLSFP